MTMYTEPKLTAAEQIDKLLRERRQQATTKEIEAKRADKTFLKEIESSRVRYRYYLQRRWPFIKREPIASTNELMHRTISN